jgi:hypothetical protein
MKRRIILGFIVAIIVIVGAVVVYQIRNAPPTSTVEVTCLSHEETCLKLPIMTGTSLTDQTEIFPDSLTHPYQLVIMAFEREQQPAMLDFVPLFQELTASRPDVTYYSLITLGDVPLPIRPLISGGLVSVMPDPDIQESTYLFYLTDTDALLEALNLPDADTLRSYIFDQSGNVLWQSEGVFTDELADDLRNTLASLPVIE